VVRSPPLTSLAVGRTAEVFDAGAVLRRPSHEVSIVAIPSNGHLIVASTSFHPVISTLSEIASEGAYSIVKDCEVPGVQTWV